MNLEANYLNLKKNWSLNLLIDLNDYTKTLE